MHYRSSLSKVRGLGSAKSGTQHWWFQRVSAAALVPLSYWLIVFLELAIHAPYQETITWIKTPLHSVAIISWILAAFYHAALGLQVVVEDYVAAEDRKIFSIWVIKLIFMILTLAALIAVFRIILTG